MRVFYFNITYACNSRCKFCAANHPILTDDNSQMTLEQFKAVCKAKPGKDLYFYVDGKTSLADCYAHIIGGYMEYDGNAVEVAL